MTRKGATAKNAALSIKVSELDIQNDFENERGVLLSVIDFPIKFSKEGIIHESRIIVNLTAIPGFELILEKKIPE